MPTYFIFNGMRFFFYSNDHEPIHVHVTKGKGGREAKAKFNAIPGEDVELIENYGLSSKDLEKARKQIEEKRDGIIEMWKKHFNEED